MNWLFTHMQQLKNSEGIESILFSITHTLSSMFPIIQCKNRAKYNVNFKIIHRV